MKLLNTIKGSVCREEIKKICPHEHLFLDMTHEAVAPETRAERERFYGEITMETLGVLRRNPYVVRTNLILDSVQDSINELKYLEREGCNLLVEVTSVGLGRDLKKLKQVSEETDLHIAVGCGFFVHETIPEDVARLSADAMAEIILGEIEDGIGETGIKPGVIGEIGTSEVIYESERKSLLAAAKAGIRTGLPIYLHTYPWSRAGLDAVDLLMTAGVAPDQICLCHLDVSFDREYLRQALNMGVYVEFDNFGKEFYFRSQCGAFSGGPFETDVARVRMIKELIAVGKVKQILAANDLCLKASLHKYGGWGYDHVFHNVSEMMEQEGIDRADIDTILVDNPKDFLFQ